MNNESRYRSDSRDKHYINTSGSAVAADPRKSKRGNYEENRRLNQALQDVDSLFRKLKSLQKEITILQRGQVELSFLKSLQGKLVRIETGSGEYIDATLLDIDRFSLVLTNEAGKKLLVFKSSIVSISETE